MIQAVSRFIPDFMTVEEYETDKEAVYEALRKHNFCTARELAEHVDTVPYPGVRKRLYDLIDDGLVKKFPEKRECSAVNHSKEVHEFFIPVHIAWNSYNEVSESE